jgi:hypothetical protein
MILKNKQKNEKKNIRKVKAQFSTISILKNKLKKNNSKNMRKHYNKTKTIWGKYHNNPQCYF